jgi:hypothetical protein
MIYLPLVKVRFKWNQVLASHDTPAYERSSRFNMLEAPEYKAADHKTGGCVHTYREYGEASEIWKQLPIIFDLPPNESQDTFLSILPLGPDGHG